MGVENVNVSLNGSIASVEVSLDIETLQSNFINSNIMDLMTGLGELVTDIIEVSTVFNVILDSFTRRGINNK